MTLEPRERWSFKTDCRWFRGDGPCVHHKQEGVLCRECGHYQPTSQRLLLVKLGAMGDVLRTTSLLPSLRSHYTGSRISWVTRGESLDLLRGNPDIDEIIEYPFPALPRLLVQQYDLVVNLDFDYEGACLAELAQGARRLGFGCDAEGRLFALNPGAQTWCAMSLRDDLKRANRRSYQELMAEVCETPPATQASPTLYLTEEEVEFGRGFAMRHGLSVGGRIVGLNTGAGPRWPMKSWTLDGYERLIALTRSVLGAKILLLGGPAEEQRHATLLSRGGPGVYTTGGHNTLRQFASLVRLCDVVVTGDTLALHLALALGRKIVALFGPTSQAEIALDGHGVKLSAGLDCEGCYRRTCDKPVNCANALSAEAVFDGVARMLGQGHCVR